MFNEASSERNKSASRITHALPNAWVINPLPCWAEAFHADAHEGRIWLLHISVGSEALHTLRVKPRAPVRIPPYRAQWSQPRVRVVVRCSAAPGLREDHYES